MGSELVPKKNHRVLLKELCALIMAYGKLKDLRDKKELYALLEDRVPPILNNFDKNDPAYASIESLLTDVIENLGIIIKLVKE